MVAFEVSRYPEMGYYSEAELGRESTLYRLILQSDTPIIPGELPEMTGRIKINFENEEGICVMDDLNELAGNLCSKAAAKIASGKAAAVGFQSHYGNLFLQPLNNLVFISGDFSLTGTENGLFKEKAYVCSREGLLKGLTECYARYQAFRAKFLQLVGT